MSFARAYDDAFPRIALGHWPPIFYLFEGLWTLVFSASRQPLMMMMAVLSAGCGVAVWRLWRETPGRWSVFAIPIVRWACSTVAPELLVVLFCTLAAGYWARYLKHGRASDSAAFGLPAAAAIMTKQNGLLLAVVPPLALIWNWCFDLVRRVSFWIPGAVVCAICLPWYWFTLPVAREGWQGSTHARFLLASVASANALSICSSMGAGLIAPLLRRCPSEAIWATSFALLVASFVFHTFKTRCVRAATCW